MKCYKGFDKNLQCRGFQYKEGRTYEEDSASLCHSGFHACEDPLNVFRYYPPGAGSRYHEVELEDVSDEREDDTKLVGKKITVGAEIGIPGIVKAHIEYVKQNVEKHVAAGNSGAISAGESGSASAGEYGSASAGWSGSASAGKYGSAVSRGKASVDWNGVVLVRGRNVKAKGGLGAIVVIVEENDDNHDVKSWCAGVVDGEKIKPDTWYKCVDGEFVECEE